jgi:hypothetical protein
MQIHVHPLIQQFFFYFFIPIKLVQPQLLQEILYTTTTGLIKPSGSNMVATIEEIMHLLPGEFLGSRNL